MTDTPLVTAVDLGNAMINERFTRQMSKDETNIMVNLIMSRGSFKFKPEDDLPFSVKVALAHLSAHNVLYTDETVLMVSALCDRPGTVVMYCAVLKALEKKNGRAATLDDLCKEFPMGFPTEDALHSIWERQKARDGQYPDNFLDRSSAWE